jgi:hypothetical protein
MIFLNIFFQCSGAYAYSVEVYRSKKCLVLLDVSSLKDNGDYVTAWTKWIFQGEILEKFKKLYGNGFAFTMNFIAFKVGDKANQFISSYTYSNDGTVLESDTGSYSPNKFEPLPPGSMGESIWESVMAMTNH